MHPLPFMRGVYSLPQVQKESVAQLRQRLEEANSQSHEQACSAMQHGCDAASFAGAVCSLALLCALSALGRRRVLQHIFDAFDKQHHGPLSSSHAHTLMRLSQSSLAHLLVSLLFCEGYLSAAEFAAFSSLPLAELAKPSKAKSASISPKLSSAARLQLEQMQAQQAAADKAGGVHEERKQPEQISSVAARFRADHSLRLSRDDFASMLESATQGLKATQLQKGQQHIEPCTTCASAARV